MNPRPGLLAPTSALAWREVVRFLRQRNRIIGAIGAPLMFWALIGSGMGDSFRAPDAAPGTSYLAYFYPGTILLVVLFTAIFSTISIIEDRRDGFLQGVLVSPAPRSAIVLGKLLGGTALATLQAALLLALAPVAGLPLSWAGAASFLAVTLVVGFALTGLGFLFAWRTDSVAGFHAVMNLVLMPLWLLSGALFPVHAAADWIRALCAVNPVRYGLSAMRQSLQPSAVGPAEPSFALCLAILTLFAILITWSCIRLAEHPGDRLS